VERKSREDPIIGIRKVENNAIDYQSIVPTLVLPNADIFQTTEVEFICGCPKFCFKKTKILRYFRMEKRAEKGLKRN